MLIDDIRAKGEPIGDGSPVDSEKMRENFEAVAKTVKASVNRTVGCEKCKDALAFACATPYYIRHKGEKSLHKEFEPVGVQRLKLTHRDGSVEECWTVSGERAEKLEEELKRIGAKPMSEYEL